MAGFSRFCSSHILARCVLHVSSENKHQVSECLDYLRKMFELCLFFYIGQSEDGYSSTYFAVKEHYSEAKCTPLPHRRLLGMVESSGSPPNARFAHMNNPVRGSWYDTLPPYLFRIGRRHVEKSALPYISIPESGWNLLHSKGAKSSSSL